MNYYINKTMNEKIKIYTEVPSTIEALRLAEAGEQLAFRRETTEDPYIAAKLVAIKLTSSYPYETYETKGTITRSRHCYTFTELDPCRSPEGFPELEPWMAYVGKDLKSEDYPNIPDQGGNQCFFAPQRHSSVWKPGCHIFGGGHLAIDVRTAWSQEHFPEHCRIRNYQAPDAFDIAWNAEPNKPCSESFARFFYELGQASPTKNTVNNTILPRGYDNKRDGRIYV